MTIASLQLTKEKALTTLKLFQNFANKFISHSKISSLASYFSVQGSPEIKRGAKKDWWKLYQKLKLGDYLQIIFKKLSTFKLYEFFSLCPGHFWLYQTNEINLTQHYFNY